MIVQPIRDQNPSVGQKSHILRPREMRFVIPRHPSFAQRHQQLVPIIRKHVDLVESLVHHPHSTLGIVRADPQSVRTRAIGSLAQVVPLVP